MKKHYQHFALVVFLFASLCVEAQAQQPQTVNDGRPVSNALMLVEQAYNIPIDFEDIARNRDTDVRDHQIMDNWSIKLSRDATAASSFEDRHTTAAKDIARILAAYNAANGPTTFRVIDHKDRFEVLPAEAQDLHLLDALVTINPQTRTADEFINALGEAIQKATGVKVDGSGPVPLFFEHQTTLGANNEPARSVLFRLFKEMPIAFQSDPGTGGGSIDIPTTYAWDLLCTWNKYCSINIRGVAPEGKGISAMTPTPAASSQ